MKDIIRCFAEAAARARAGGVDGLEVHSHESFLHAQLLNPVWNRREDEYGGSLENRMRFLVETLKAMRSAVGPQCPIGVRLKADDMAEGGMTLEDYQEVVRRLEALRLVDYISVTGGDGGLHHGPFPRPDGEWLQLVGNLRAGTDLPLMHAGRVTEPAMADRAVTEGQVDVMLMTKAHIADPHFARKAYEGRLADIRYCTRCLQSCIGKMEHMTCVYNPVTSRELAWSQLRPAARKKRVVIVGAGPAGMEAALAASQRGHEVVVLERSAQVGGQVLYASRSPLRQMFARIAEFYSRQADNGTFEIRLNTEATVDSVVSLRPDAVIIATGSSPRRRVLHGGPNPVTVHEALDGAADEARKALIVDREDFTRPLVVADYLSDRGIDVEFVTPSATISAGVNSMTREELHNRLTERGVRFAAGEDVVRWIGSDLLIRNVFTATERFIAGIDAVVIADGSDVVNDLGLALHGLAQELHVIGDANIPRTVEEATYQGARVGRLL